MRSILLVDDSGLFSSLAEAIRRRTDARVLTASSGREALDMARGENPDIIFIDAEMKGMTGADICRVLKADPRFLRTPIVLASGSDGVEEDRRAGADGYLSKPIDEVALFEQIREHLQIFPRGAERSSAGWSVTFWRHGIPHTGTIRDLSRGGLFVRTLVRQPVGARLETSFEVPGRTPPRRVVAEAIVVRVGPEPERGLGCRFFRLDSTSRLHLEECLRLLAARRPPVKAAEEPLPS